MVDITVDSELWLRRFHPPGRDSHRLVVLPHAGGSASFFRPLAAALAPELDVLTVQYPGRQDRRSEKSIEDIGEYADRIHEVLLAEADRPTALYGHSMGAILAFEVACRLEASGHAPLAVIASGRRAPATHREENVHQRDNQGIVTELRRLSGTHTELLGDDEILQMILPALRSDYTAVERYICPAERTVNCPILALTGDQDPRTSLDEAKAWDRHTTGRFELEVLSGGHFFIVDHQRRLAERIAEFVSGAASER
ncbi:surfactin synthase thioesterase subunit [Kitasatospora sp. GP30]|uniref:thioesterase II family protein n=1 Tax=Kitasatospora sp. GP30 TaxID=3035084 RepID=UPI000C707758|nr:alpha/beta fold hydrolase [Kitasatospora sp. GP30]MDH6142640.1 surfactin synthase thioesterase subunit [Kitasatospora sp. GP30]